MSEIDLGSEKEEFNPFADDDELEDDGTDETVEEDAPEQEKHEARPPKADKSSDSGNPLENAIDKAETKDAEKAKKTLSEKLPVFEFSGASEDIEDTSVTFDELRIAKAVDFPELEDGKRVKWTVEYCGIKKEMTDVKGTSIAKMKAEIEASKAFTDALKKSKDKNPVCKVKPRVAAQTKGTASGYKGVFTCMEEVEAAGKAISILPARDGKVYEVRKNALGVFTTPVVGCKLLSDVQAGFVPALGIPPIPMNLMMRIIAFFRYFTHHHGDSEALVNVYWDSHNKEFIVDTPEQIVSKVSVHSTENPDFLNERFIHYMDIHSHNRMRAFFSATDDNDEKATRLYTVIGCLDKYFPEIKTRISNGGKFHEIDPAEVFEYIAKPFPPEWTKKVTMRSAHKDVSDKEMSCACIAENHLLDILRDKDNACDINEDDGEPL